MSPALKRILARQGPVVSVVQKVVQPVTPDDDEEQQTEQEGGE